MQNKSYFSRLTTLGVVGVVVSLAGLAVNPFQPQNFRATPEAVIFRR